MKLKRLNINAFRGATRPFELLFSPSEKITMIYGENGAGKSTIADALVCLCTTDFGSLDDKSGADKKFVVSADRNSSDLLIQLDTDQGHFSAIFSGRKMVKNTTLHLPYLRHLRRSSVVELSTATPAKRYEQLAEYFDLSGIVKSEEALRNLNKNLKMELNSVQGTLAEVERIVQMVWQHEGAPFESWEKWILLEMAKNVGEERQKLKNIKAVLDAWSHINLVFTTLDQIQIEGVQVAAAHKKWEEALAHQRALDATGPSALLLIEKALQFFTSEVDEENCPVCQQKIEAQTLRAELSTRLENMNALRETAAAYEAAQTEHVRLQTLWKNHLQTFSHVLSAFLDALQSTENTPALQALIVDFQATSLSQRAQATLFKEKLPALTAFLQGKQAMADTIAKTLEQYMLLSENWQSIQGYRNQKSQLHHLYTRAEAALRTVELTRKSYIEDELAAISTEIDQYYDFLHPEEKMGDVRLFLKEKGKNSLELTARFHGSTDIAPQSVYSESHLDTLALCIFLALAKRYDSASTILLLDDVLGACDEAHIDRFMQLLTQESAHFAHIIFTTHQRFWRDRYAGQSGIQFVDLLPWSMEKGISVF